MIWNMYLLLCMKLRLLILKRYRRTVSQLSVTVQLDMHKKHFQAVIIALNCR